MAGYVMAGSALLGAYGAIKQGQWQKEAADRQAAIDRQAAQANADFQSWKSEQEAAQNEMLAQTTREVTTGQAETTYQDTVNALRKKVAASMAKGGASGFNINAGSFLSALNQEYDVYASEAQATKEQTIQTGEAKARTYELAGKINLEEEKLAQSGYTIAGERASLLEAGGEQAKIGSYWTMAAQGAKAYGLWDYASTHKGVAPERTLF